MTTDDKNVKMINFLMNKGELTGSYRWKCNEEFSDIDFFMEETEAMKIFASLKAKEGTDSSIHNINDYDGFSSDTGKKEPHKLRNTHNILFNIDTQKFNILAYKAEDMPKVKTLNNIMDDIMNNTDIGKDAKTNKAIRCELFQAALKIAFDVHMEEVEIGFSEVDFPF